VFVVGWVSHLDYFWTEPRFARFLRRLASFSRIILLDNMEPVCPTGLPSTVVRIGAGGSRCRTTWQRVLGRFDNDPMSQAEPRERIVVRRLADNEVDRVAAVLGLARLYQGNGLYLVAWDNEEPLGHACLALTDPPELQDVQVRPEQRRRGVASAITSEAELRARSLGFDRLRLEVSEGNAPAQALYRSCGFADIGAPPRRVQGTIMIRTGPIEVDDTLLTWEKRLARQL